MSVHEDLRKAFKAISAAKPKPTVTIHHPKCRALETGDALKCNCGGSAFPVSK